jgi:hypothetical protein
MKGLRKSSRTALRWSVVTATGFSRVMRLSLTPTCCATDAQVYHSEPQVCREEARKKRMAHPAHGRSRLSRPATPFTSSPLRHCLSTPPPGGPLTHLFFSFPCRLRPSCSVSLALFVFCSLSCPSTCATRRPGFGQRRPATTRSPRGAAARGRARPRGPSEPPCFLPSNPTSASLINLQQPFDISPPSRCLRSMHRPPSWSAACSRREPPTRSSASGRYVHPLRPAVAS